VPSSCSASAAAYYRFWPRAKKALARGRLSEHAIDGGVPHIGADHGADCRKRRDYERADWRYRYDAAFRAAYEQADGAEDARWEMYRERAKAEIARRGAPAIIASLRDEYDLELDAEEDADDIVDHVAEKYEKADCYRPDGPLIDRLGREWDMRNGTGAAA